MLPDSLGVDEITQDQNASKKALRSCAIVYAQHSAQHSKRRLKESL